MLGVRLLYGGSGQVLTPQLGCCLTVGRNTKSTKHHDLAVKSNICSSAGVAFTSHVGGEHGTELHAQNLADRPIRVYAEGEFAEGRWLAAGQTMILDERDILDPQVFNVASEDATRLPLSAYALVVVVGEGTAAQPPAPAYRLPSASPAAFVPPPPTHSAPRGEKRAAETPAMREPRGPVAAADEAASDEEEEEEEDYESREKDEGGAAAAYDHEASRPPSSEPILLWFHAFLRSPSTEQLRTILSKRPSERREVSPLSLTKEFGRAHPELRLVVSTYSAALHRNGLKTSLLAMFRRWRRLPSNEAKVQAAADHS